MSGDILTTASSITCPHGGQAMLTTANTKSFASGGAALLETDVHPILGCPFTLPGPKPSPCIRLEWSAGASQVTINSAAVVVMSSLGKCLNAEGAIQGLAIKSTQMKASAR